LEVKLKEKLKMPMLTQKTAEKEIENKLAAKRELCEAF
jgi:hypothetical protein